MNATLMEDNDEEGVRALSQQVDRAAYLYLCVSIHVTCPRAHYFLWHKPKQPARRSFLALSNSPCNSVATAHDAAQRNYLKKRNVLHAKASID